MKLATTTTTTTSAPMGGEAYAGASHFSGSARTEPIALTMYTVPPSRSIRLDEFEQLAVERLKVMNSLRDLRDRALLKDVGQVISDLVRGTCLEVRTEEQKYDDLQSHWILRMAFCANEESRRRFLQFESDIFRYRFEMLRKVPGAFDRFVQTEGLKYEKISPAERAEVERELEDIFKANHAHDNMPIAVTSEFGLIELQFSSSTNSTATAANFRATPFYKVPFTDVCDLVSNRRVLLRGGLAYIAEGDLISSLAGRFTSALNERMEVASKTLPIALHDERIGPLFQRLQKTYASHSEFSMAGRGTVAGAGVVTPADIPTLARQSFPMCGRRMETAMRTEHHLKYTGRVQFMLFLKGVGLSMEDCLAYFQQEFMKKPMTSEEFRKKGYAYSIRHSYGREGKRADYTPWSCMKAINASSPGTEERHGCPFKHVASKSQLTKMCVEMGGVPEDKVKAIVEAAQSNNYQIACRMHWEVLHPGGNSDAVGNHPNAWFDESVKYHLEKEREKKEKAGNVPAAATATAAPTAPSVAPQQLQSPPVPEGAPEQMQQQQPETKEES